MSLRVVSGFDSDFAGGLSFKPVSSSIVSLYCDGLLCTISKRSNYFEERFHEALCGPAKALCSTLLFKGLISDRLMWYFLLGGILFLMTLPV